MKKNNIYDAFKVKKEKEKSLKYKGREIFEEKKKNS